MSASPTHSEPSPTPELPLPSTAALAKATGVALAIAVVLLVLVVLPAEYNIDITGFGKAIGLTRLSAPPEEAKSVSATTGSSAEGPGAVREDRAVVEVPAGKGLEYKFSLRAGDKLKYEWSVQAGGTALAIAPPALFYDFHGEPEGAKKGVFESFCVSTADKARGTFTAPFAGTHGWYWKNESEGPLQVTLVTSGSYEVLGVR